MSNICKQHPMERATLSRVSFSLARTTYDDSRSGQLMSANCYVPCL